MRRLALLAVLSAAVVAACAARSGSAANECKGLRVCVPISGPWVVVHKGTPSTYLLSCGKDGVVGGLDAVATTSAVRVSFDGRLGSPVQPGTTTSTSAYFTGLLVSGRTAAFQPWIGCVPSSGGGGRTTVAYQVEPGPALDRVAHVVVVGSGTVKSASVACPAGEPLVGGWDTLAFRTAKPPDLRLASFVQIERVATGRKEVVTVSASDALAPEAHAVVQVGAECAP